MRTIKFLQICFLLTCSYISNAQNMGIGNTNPQTTLDIKGGFATRAITVNPFANGVNIPANEAFVIIGTATDTVTAYMPAYADGHKIVILNNSGHTVKFPVFNFTILQSEAKEFICRNPGGWSMITGASNNNTSWSTSGNSNLDTTKFLGTTDSSMLLFKTKNFTSGQVGNLNNNVSFGYKSLQRLENTSTVYQFNTAVGDFSMAGREFGYNNTAVGYASMVTNVGNNNTAVGANALVYSEVGYNNTGVGVDALAVNNGIGNVALGNAALSADSFGMANVAIGFASMYNSINSNNSVAIGTNALRNDTAANGIIAIGNAALYNNNNKIDNLAIGDSALFNNGSNAGFGVQGKRNTAIGNRTLKQNVVGYENTAVGVYALSKNLSNGNTAVGADVLYNNTNGSANTAMGNQALFNNETGSINVSIGASSMSANKSGSSNVAIGTSALASNKSGNGNIAIGAGALLIDTLPNGTVAIGRAALYNNNKHIGNLAIGDSALYSNGLGSNPSIESFENTAIGDKALLKNTKGNLNTAIGAYTLEYNTTGIFNTAVGAEALLSNTTGLGNVALGADALLYNEEGSVNIGIGRFALNENNSVPRTINTQANGNVGIGDLALSANRLGSRNTCVGTNAGYRVRGDHNTIIGAQPYIFPFALTNIDSVVFVGYNAGRGETSSNKLYIENTPVGKDSALIYGDFVNDSLVLNAKTIIRDNAIVKGFTKLGGNATDIPAVKMKKLTGTTANASGAVGIAHGLTQSKILSVSVFVNGNTGNDIPPRSTYTGFEYDYYVGPTQIFIKNIATNDANIINRPFRILITYEQ